MDFRIDKQREGLVMKFISNQPYHLASNFPKEDAADLDTDYLGPSPHHVNYCGFEVCRPGHLFGPHSRTSYLVHIVYSGKGKYFVNGRIYEISKGQIFLIYPGVTTTYQADEKEPWSYGWIGFNGHRSEFILSQSGFSANHLVVTVDDIEPLRDSILNIMNTHKITYANELYRTAELLRVFAYIMDHRLDANAEMPNYSRAVYAQLAMRYLESNYMNQIKIAQLADYIGIDRSYLTRSFHEEYHISPQEYLIRLRMEKAEYLLAHSSASISDIAANVGYPDALAFSKIFRRRTGVSPSDYRKTS